MGNYLWVYIIGAVAFVTLLIFLITFPKDHSYIKKLRKSKANYLLNFSLLIFSLADIGLIIYLFMLLKEQVEVFS